MEPFKLWLEFEHVQFEPQNSKNDFCNIHVDLPDGRHYGINVWTYGFLSTTINNNRLSGKNLAGLYLQPPDLLVDELSRNCIERSIADLLANYDLEEALNPGVLSPKK